MLVEAAGRLFGTLDLDAVLPDVLDLAQSTLAVDAYALWRRDPDHDTWTLQASAGLSPEYVAAAPAAIDGNESVVDARRAARHERHPVDPVADAGAQGGARRRGHARDDRGAAAPRRRGHRHARLLLAPRRARSAPRTFAPRAPSRASPRRRSGPRPSTRSRRSSPRRDACSPRRATSSPRRSTTRRRSRTSRSSSSRGSPTGASSTSSARTATIQRLAVAHEDPAKVERAQSLIAKLPVDPDSPRGVPAVIRTQQARVAAGDRGRADRGGFPRPARPARGAARARPPELDDRAARRAQARARRDHVRRVRVGPQLRRGGSRDRARPRAAGGRCGRQRGPLPRGAAEGEPGAVPRRGRQRAERAARLQRDARRRSRGSRCPGSRTGASSTSSRAPRSGVSRSPLRTRCGSARSRSCARSTRRRGTRRSPRRARCARARPSSSRSSSATGSTTRSSTTSTCGSWRSSIPTPRSRCRSSRAARRSARSRLPGRRRGATTASATSR